MSPYNSMIVACLAVMFGTGCASELDAPLAVDTEQTTSSVDCFLRLQNWDPPAWKLRVKCPEHPFTSLELTVKNDHSGQERVFTSAFSEISAEFQAQLQDLGTGRWTIDKIKLAGAEKRQQATLFPEVLIPDPDDFSFRSDTEDTSGKLVVHYDFGQTWPGTMDYVSRGEEAPIPGSPFVTGMGGGLPAGACTPFCAEGASAGVHETGLFLEGPYYQNDSGKPSGWYGALTRVFDVVPKGHGRLRTTTHSFVFEIFVEKTMLSASGAALPDN